MTQHAINKPDLIGNFLDVHYNILEYTSKSGLPVYEVWLTIPKFIDKPTVYDLFGSPLAYSTIKGRTKVLYNIAGQNDGDALETVKHMIRILS